MSESKPGRFVHAASRVVEHRSRDYIAHRPPVKRSFIFLVEAVGVALFALGVLSCLAFSAAETPLEAARRGLAKFPTQCEAAYFNHGTYLCLYTIHDHPFLFAISVVTLVGGVSLMVWGQRRWVLRSRHEA